MNGKIQQRQLDIDHFVNVLFKDNIRNEKITLAMELQSIREVFLFCLNVLCKGLVTLYGEDVHGHGCVNLTTISFERLSFVKGRMSLAGIIVHTRITPLSVYEATGLPFPKHARIDLPNLELIHVNAPLEEYTIDVWTTEHHIVIFFEISATAASRYASSCHKDLNKYIIR